jgi:hypothetical protein
MNSHSRNSFYCKLTTNNQQANQQASQQANQQTDQQTD